MGSGPVGEDDLWYHHIPGTLHFDCLRPPPRNSQLALPGGSRPPSWLQRASRALSAGSRGLSAGIRALPADPETLLADSRVLLLGSRALLAGSGALTAGSETLPAGSELHLAGSEPLPAGSDPLPALLYTIGHFPLRACCPITTKLTVIKL